MSEASTVRLAPHEHLVEPWRQSVRGGSVADRTFTEVTASLPPYIVGLEPAIPSALGSRMDDALREIAALDETHGAP